MNWKGCGSGRGLIWDTVPIFTWRDRGGTPRPISFLWICAKPFAKLSVFLQGINIGIVTLHRRAGGEVKMKVRVSLKCTKHFTFLTSPLEWGECWASCSGPFKSSERIKMCVGQDCVLEGMISCPCRESSADRCAWSQYLSLRCN